MRCGGLSGGRMVTGIAAPQVGHNLRMIAVRELRSRGMYSKLFINPVLVELSSDTQVISEGCLSDDLIIDVVRAKSCVLEARTEYDDVATFSLSGTMVAIVQHELEHLDGLRRVAKGSDRD